MKGIVFTAAVALTLIIGWVFVGPLFVDQTVDESFELTLADGSLNMPAIMDLPEPNRRLLKPRIMRTAAAREQESVEPMPTQANTGPIALAKGQFVNADKVHKGSGDATLYALGGDQHLLRLENFRSTNGPALVVYLSKHANPANAADVLEAGFVNLGPLKGNVGNQNYPLPAGTAVGEFHSVVIWCELFDVLFSPAALVPIAAG